ncbi:MAG: amidase family protein, partial [Candidatus Adiutricales bacterium]
MNSVSEMERICYTPAVELAEMIRKKDISPVEVVNTFFKRIEDLNPKITAYCTLTMESALREAERAEQMVMAGEDLGLLHGLPYSIKDLVYTKSVRTMQGSKIYEEFVPEEDAPLVERLKAAGG